MSDPMCVCGCSADHVEHCEHGCTCVHPDDGSEHGGSVFRSGLETYEGRYKRRFG